MAYPSYYTSEYAKKERIGAVENAPIIVLGGDIARFAPEVSTGVRVLP